MSATDTFPALNPLAVAIVFVLIPPLFVTILVKYVCKDHEWRGGLRKHLIGNISVALNYHAPMITSVHGFLAILLFLNQGAYVLNHFDTSSDVNYYLRVNRPEFENYNAIVAAQGLNSIDALRPQLQGENRRLSDSNNPADWYYQDRAADVFSVDSRFLTTTSAYNSDNHVLNLIYHRSDWGDVISSDQLTNICLTERTILANLHCLDHSEMRSFVAANFDPVTCEYLTSYEETRGQVGQFVNQRYFQDRTMYSSIRSPILISYLRSGTCGELYSTDEFAALINAHAVGDIAVHHASHQFLGEELQAATDQLEGVMFYSTLFAFLFLVISVRGFITSIATLFCILLSMVNAAALLSCFGYGNLSAINAACLLVMLSVGAGFVHLFGVAWRNTMKRGEDAYPQSLSEIFDTVGQGSMLTFLACCLAFFALGRAPVIFVSQLGNFVGLSMVLFLFLFAYVLVPLWTWMTWLFIPHLYYRKLRLLRERYCPVCLHSKHSRRHHQHQHHHRLRDGSDHSSASANDLEADAASHQDGDVELHSAHGDSSSDSSSQATTAVNMLHSFYLRLTDAAPAVPEPPSAVEIPIENGVAEEVDEPPAECAVAEAALSDDARSEDTLPGLPNAILGHSTDAVDGEYHTTSLPSAEERRLEDGCHDPVCDKVTITSANCIAKRPLLVVSVVMLLVTLVLFFLSLFLSVNRVDTDFSTVRLVNRESNLATLLDVFQNYRGDVFYAVDESAGEEDVANNRTFAPSAMPTARPTAIHHPTAVPTARPTVSSKPTTQPTLVPTSAPTAAPTTDTGVTEQVFTDFRITGCWGLSVKKENFDSDAEPKFDYYAFRDYMEKGNQGIVGDFVATCDYVDSHRDYLNVHPDWNRTTDCISNQYFDVYNSSHFTDNNVVRTTASTLFAWSTTVDSASTLLGMYKSDTAHAALPVWVCANFTGRSYVSSFHEDMPFGAEMRQRWEDVFYKHGSVHAQKSGVSTVVGSTEFTYPLLGLYITWQVHYQAAVFIVGYTALLFLFTACDVGLTLSGVLGLFTTFFLTSFIGLYEISSILDLEGVVVLILLLPLLVSFPAHLTSSYQSNRIIAQREALKQDTSYAILPVLWKTHLYAAVSLASPLLLAVLAAIAFTWSDYALLQRLGWWYIICAIVANLFAVIVQPFLLVFSYQSTFCTLLLEDYDDEVETTTPPGWTEQEAYVGSTELDTLPRDYRVVSSDTLRSYEYPENDMRRNSFDRRALERDTVERNTALNAAHTMTNSHSQSRQSVNDVSTSRTDFQPQGTPAAQRRGSRDSAGSRSSNNSRTPRSVVSWSDQSPAESPVVSDNEDTTREENFHRIRAINSFTPPAPNGHQWYPQPQYYAEPQQYSPTTPYGYSYGYGNMPQQQYDEFGVPVMVYRAPLQQPMRPLQQASPQRMRVPSQQTLVPVPVQAIVQRPVVIEVPADSQVLVHAPSPTPAEYPPQRYVIGQCRTPSEPSVLQTPTPPEPVPTPLVFSQQDSSEERQPTTPPQVVVRGVARTPSIQAVLQPPSSPQPEPAVPVQTQRPSGDERQPTTPPQVVVRGVARTPSIGAVNRQMYLPPRGQLSPAPSFYDRRTGSAQSSPSPTMQVPAGASVPQIAQNNTTISNNERPAQDSSNSTTSTIDTTATTVSAAGNTNTATDNSITTDAAATVAAAAAASAIAPSTSRTPSPHKMHPPSRHARVLRPVRTPPAGTLSLEPAAVQASPPETPGIPTPQVPTFLPPRQPRAGGAPVTLSRPPRHQVSPPNETGSPN